MMKKIGQLISQVQVKIQSLFHKEQLDQMARDTLFIQRSSSKLEAEDFVKLMTTEVFADTEVSTEALCDRLAELNPKADITPQALHSRINSSYAVDFLKAVFEKALEKNLQPLLQGPVSRLLKAFNRVYLQDSTQCTLHEKLAKFFKGSGGSASKSSLKIDLIYEVKHLCLQALCVVAGVYSDHSLAKDLFFFLQAGDLVLRDLGYFRVEDLCEIAKRPAFFLTRHLPKTDVYLTPELGAPALKLAKYLKKNFKHQAVIDLNIYLGSKKLPCRLIAYKLPAAVASERKRKVLTTARKKGKTVSQDYLDGLEFALYLTNVPRSLWPAAVVGTIYRLRWQVELIFKHWKSLLHIHLLRGTRPQRILCLLYGRLILIALLTMISAFVFWYAQTRLKKELSPHKLIVRLKRKDRLAKAIHHDQLLLLLEDLVSQLPKKLSKQKRARKTTFQLIHEGVAYLDSFPTSREVSALA